MKYHFSATRAFWRSFAKLPAQQQRRARNAFAIFKENPFDPRLRSHKIQKLSARYGRVIYAAEIEADLRVVFYTESNTVVTVDIGSHDLYHSLFSHQITNLEAAVIASGLKLVRCPRSLAPPLVALP
jgi:mRNA-degrading endonuclease YafQ of YafQ-DinJ toxin-antitoxin module